MKKRKFLPPIPSIWRHAVNFDGTHSRPGEQQQHMGNNVTVVIKGQARIPGLRVADALSIVRKAIK